jgi:hypothetical protein
LPELLIGASYKGLFALVLEFFCQYKFSFYKLKIQKSTPLSVQAAGSKCWTFVHLKDVTCAFLMIDNSNGRVMSFVVEEEKFSLFEFRFIYERLFAAKLVKEVFP